LLIREPSFDNAAGTSNSPPPPERRSSVQVSRSGSSIQTRPRSNTEVRAPLYDEHGVLLGAADDPKLQQLGLPADEVIYGEFQCQLNSQFRPHGTLYATQRRLVFEPSSLLGAKKRTEIMFTRIESVNKGKSGALRIDMPGGRCYEFGSFQDSAVAFDIVQCMFESVALARGDDEVYVAVCCCCCIMFFDLLS
jgi:hypothetical protein